MNKRTVILERAMQRLAKAEQSVDARQQLDMAHLIAYLIDENDVYFFKIPHEDFIVIASLKAVTTLH